MQLSSLLLTAVVGLTGFQGVAPDGGIPISPCLVTLIDEVKLPADLPSQEAGVLTTLRTEIPGPDGKPVMVRVRAGMEVKQGQLLGQIDNRRFNPAQRPGFLGAAIEFDAVVGDDDACHVRDLSSPIVLSP